MKIAVISLTWNEGTMVPFFLKHYEQIADQIIVYDAMSDDGTTRNMLSAHPLVKLIDRKSTGGAVDDESNQQLKNTAWQNVDADWFIVVDFDEFITTDFGISAVRDYLSECDRCGVTLPMVAGFDMVGDTVPPDGLLTDQITEGVPSLLWSKRAVFHRGVIPNYSAGAHFAAPLGRVWQDDNPFLKLLHYKFLSREYVIRRMREHHGLSNRNHELKYGYTHIRGELRPSPTVWLEQYDELKPQRRPVVAGSIDRRFKHDWFSYHTNKWRKHLAHLIGKPDLRFLEIGSFEGRSACWMLENILTDPSSLLYCIDPFVPFDVDGHGTVFDAYPAFHRNVIKPHGKQVSFFKSMSQSAVQGFDNEYFDFCYIDGSHTAADTYADAVNVWPKMKKGGLVTFDDYTWICGGPDPASRPQMAIDRFLREHAAELDVLDISNQVTVRRK